jgi:hypothetical protein
MIANTTSRLNLQGVDPIIHAPNLFVPVDLPLPLLKVFQLARQT